MLDFLILGFATWRLSFMLTIEAGPFGMFLKLRELAGIKLPDEFPQLVEDEKTEAPPLGFLQPLLGCTWCVSVWVGFAFCVAYWLFPVMLYPLTILAVSGIACLINGFVR